ncbi:hypothetical protein BDV12DRAFT_190027 [Aspergillus spectabilis]
MQLMISLLLKIAWIGLGNMSRGTAKNLATKGPLPPPLIIYSRTLTRTELFAPRIGTPSLPISYSLASETTQAIQQPLDNCIAAGRIKDKILIDCSTVHPDTTSSIAAKIEDNGNTFVLRMVETIAEGLVVAEKSGFGTDALHQFFETVFPGPYVAYSARMRTGDYHQIPEPLFAVNLARKEAKHALDMAERSGARMRRVKQEMGARGDLAGVYGVMRREAGLDFSN